MEVVFQTACHLASTVTRFDYVVKSFQFAGLRTRIQPRHPLEPAAITVQAYQFGELAR